MGAITLRFDPAESAGARGKTSAGCRVHIPRRDNTEIERA